MEELKVFEPLFRNSLFQFFLYMALLQLLAQVFLDRRVAFWISSLSTTFIWLKSFDPLTPLKGWAIILFVFILYVVPKVFLHFNLFLYLQGKKRCPECYSGVHWRAKVCPFCAHRFRGMEKAGEED
ncbi:MAG: hypothetical protein N2648_06000 [Aquificaceae bacterium]|nr:hypothetical protein [Aquificaceae bacterium]MCX7990172.1 hypothetical protein [Aquificaceae bacterium]MDW8295132.1 hypothetical protein [Aquificaceae bacterium]